MNIVFDNYILDNDFYKFTMHHAVNTLYPEYKVKYKMYIRDSYNDISKKDLNKLIAELYTYSFTFKRTDYSLPENGNIVPIMDDIFINSVDFLPSFYWKNLSTMSLNEKDITITGKILKTKSIEITYEGFFKDLILLEVPFITIISKFLTKLKYYDNKISNVEKNINLRIKQINVDLEKLNDFANNNKTTIYISEFGTRRRITSKLQRELIFNLNNKQFTNIVFQGTSNVLFSLANKTVPVGTMAHEWIMFHTFMSNPIMANEIALNAWDKVYKGKLGIALTDTYTSEIFFKTLPTYLAKMYDGLRHDSGSPLKFMDNAYEFYKKHNVDPKTKKIIFSNRVDPSTIKEIIKHNKKHNYNFMYSFGIGSYFTNSLPSIYKQNNTTKIKAIDVVIKLDSVNNVPVCKLSDNDVKHTGDLRTIDFSKYQISNFLRGK